MSKLKQIYLTSFEAAILYVGLRSIYIEYLNHKNGTRLYSDPPASSELSPTCQSDVMSLIVTLYRSAADRGSIGIIIPRDYLVLCAAMFAAENCRQLITGGRHEAFAPDLDRHIDRLIKKLKKARKKSQGHISGSKGPEWARRLSEAWQQHRAWMRLALMNISSNSRKSRMGC